MLSVAPLNCWYIFNLIVQVEEKRDLLKKACDYHIDTCRSAMTGDGVDRHLFALYVVSQYLKLEVPFLKTVILFYLQFRVLVCNFFFKDLFIKNHLGFSFLLGAQ